jgi:iron complex transport system substrate-binding protein
MKHTFYFLLSTFYFLLFSTGCPQKPTPEIAPKEIEPPIIQISNLIDGTGVVFRLPLQTHRIISLSPSITENIKILNAENKLVGRTDYCKGLSAIASVGTMLEPSLEKIVSLKPDLVLATKDGNRLQSVNKLRELGITVFVPGESNSWKDIENNFRLCGKLLDKANESEEILKHITAELTIPPPRTLFWPKVFIQLNVTPLITAGKNTFINDMINYANGINIASDSILPWPILNVEEIIQRNPDIIIISDMGQITEQAKKMWDEERFAGINAVKNQKIFLIESDLLCQPTPLNFINAVRKIREYLK